MATYTRGTLQSILQPLFTDKEGISESYTDGLDPLYDPYFLEEEYEGTSSVIVSNVSSLSSASSKHIGGRRAPSVGTPYEVYRLFYKGDEKIEGLSLGAISADRTIPVTLFTGLKDKYIVASVEIEEGLGVSMTSPAEGERIEPLTEYSGSIFIEHEGTVVVSTTISIVFTNGIQWDIPISFSRITVPIYLLEANWAEGVSLSRSFLTDIFVGASMAQTRKSLRKIPVRRQEVSMTFKDKESSLRAWSLSQSVLSDYFYFPLYMDEARMTSVNEGNKIFCDTSYRRFEEGQYVMLRHLIGTGDASGDISGSQSYEVSLVEDDGITVDASDLESYQRGDVLYPLMKCLPNASNPSMTAFTRRKGSLTLEVTEDWGDDALALENSDYTPGTLSSLPVFDFTIDEAEDTEITFMQGGSTAESGRGFAVTLYGEPYQTQSLKVLAESRSKYWDLIGFFNYVKGKGKTFWVKGYQDFLTLTEQDGDEYYFESDLVSDDLGSIAYLWVVDADGNKDIVQILGSVDTSSGFTMTCSTSEIVTDAVYAYQAIAVRMASDMVSENWLTTSIVELSFTVEEVQGIYLT